MPHPRLSIVIPAFNEEPRIGATLDKVLAYLRRQPYDAEVLVVDDGSTDQTASVVAGRAAGRGEVRLETIPHAGKGWAVRHGMLAATGDYRLMCDADLAMPVDQVGRFLKTMAAGADVAIGSREAAGARRFDEPAVRHLMGRAFNWAVRLLAVRGIQDTQCGFKCFRAEAAEDLFGSARTRGFGFDVEVLYLARRRGYRVVEVPIDWYHQSESKVRHSIDAALMLRDTLAVRWRSVRGTYRRARR